MRVPRSAFAPLNPYLTKCPLCKTFIERRVRTDAGSVEEYDSKDCKVENDPRPVLPSAKRVINKWIDGDAKAQRDEVRRIILTWNDVRIKENQMKILDHVQSLAHQINTSSVSPCTTPVRRLTWEGIFFAMNVSQPTAKTDAFRTCGRVHV